MKSPRDKAYEAIEAGEKLIADGKWPSRGAAQLQIASLWLKLAEHDRKVSADGKAAQR